MAIKTLKNVKEIGGFKVGNAEELIKIRTSFPGTQSEREDAMDKYCIEHPIIIDNKFNMIAFTLQDGPIKEVGVNGCQVDTIIEAAKKILNGLDAKFPSEYNKTAINNLDLAIKELQQRTKDREKRGVEGMSKI